MKTYKWYSIGNILRFLIGIDIDEIRNARNELSDTIAEVKKRKENGQAKWELVFPDDEVNKKEKERWNGRERRRQGN